ncbi:MAG: ProQ/FinO family protein [Aquabacterium sp.]
MSSTPEAQAPSPDHPSNSPAEGGPAAPAAEPQGDHRASTQATAAKLAELFPALFKGTPKPLKLRIQVDIQERAPGVFTKQALSAFFRRYTGATSYLIAVSKGKERFDLDGQPAGELSDEHRKVATDELARRRANVQARREQEEAGRRQRASLLRDFETTKLTTANFCALKGVAPEQLDGLLAQARAEAAEDALRPRRPDHHPGHPGRRGDGPGRREGGGRGEGRGEGREARGDARRGPGGRPGEGKPAAQGAGDRAPREGGPRDDRPREGRPPRRS